jgi:LysM repeat protein
MLKEQMMKSDVESTREIFEDMEEDMSKSRRNDSPQRRQKNSYTPGSSGRFVLILGLGAVILILLVVLLYRGSGKQDLTSINSRLDQLEKRIASLDRYEKKIDDFEAQVKSLHQNYSRLESVAERLDKLSRQVEKPLPQPPAQKEVVQSKAKVHEVRPGDTLYRIADKYGMTLDEILRLNNLKKNSAIQPGQKLLISSERP